MPTRIERTVGLALALCGLAALTGCNGGSATGPVADVGRSGPHGGPLVALPGEKGYAEVLSEPVIGKGKGATIDARVVIYFLGTDLTGPLASLPADVTVSLRTPDAPEPFSVPVSPDPKGGGKDALAPGRFASAVGPYSVDQLIGELNATVDGQAFTAAFHSAR